MKREEALKPFVKFYGKRMGIAHKDLQDGWDQIAIIDLSELEEDAKKFYNDPANEGIELDSYNTPFYTILTQSFFNGDEEAKLVENKWAFLGILGADGGFWHAEGFGSSMQNKAVFLDLESQDVPSVIVCSALSPEIEEEEEEKYGDDDDFDWDGPRIVAKSLLELKLWIRPEDEDEPNLDSIKFEELALRVGE